MENNDLVKKLSVFKKRKKNARSCKNSLKLNTFIYGKERIEEPKGFLSQIKRSRGGKYNSIDSMKYCGSKYTKKYNKEDTLTPRKSKKNQKNNNYISEYLDKLYEDEPHLKKGVFKKKSAYKVVGFKDLNRKVSFISPKDYCLKPILRTSKNVNKYFNTNNNFFDNNKSKVIKNDDSEEQNYGYNKKYVVTPIETKKSKNDNMLLKSSIFNNDFFGGRELNRKQTFVSKVRNPEKKINLKKNNSVLNNDNRILKKKMSNKSISDKKIKKKFNNKNYNVSNYNVSNYNVSNFNANNFITNNCNINNYINNNYIDNNNNPKKFGNTANNFYINNDDKIELEKLEKFKKRKSFNITNKTEKSERKIDKKSERKSERKMEKKNEKINEINNSESIYKKRQDLLPQKSTDKTETLVQLEQENKKKKKFIFCCNPFLICLKTKDNDDEKENIL